MLLGSWNEINLYLRFGLIKDLSSPVEKGGVGTKTKFGREKEECLLSSMTPHSVCAEFCMYRSYFYPLCGGVATLKK